MGLMAASAELYSGLKGVADSEKYEPLWLDPRAMVIRIATNDKEKNCFSCFMRSWFKSAVPYRVLIQGTGKE